ncbi:ABC transporter ATP-binding protein/permease [Rhodobacteraceae bacterium XHP0102]|nr:ABC transporter ATP-binding protein/permease [Rhodobacteraceae bacterium XHP0102]
MFRFFETLVDPYTPYTEKDTPPNRLWPFMRDYAQPFKRVFLAAAVMSMVMASIELGLIVYLGRVVDLLSTNSSATLFANHGLELALVALFVVLVRPAMQFLDVGLLNNAILPNFGTLIRWRAHRHVLRQSVGWFENDFTGRIAGRIMQTPPAAGDAVFQIFDAITFSIAYFIGALILLTQSDPRLAVPLVIWCVLYGLLVRWTILNVTPASKASSDARSMTTGRVVDSYTNIHAVKLFSHTQRELDYAHEAIEHTRQTFAREMRIFTIMDVTLLTLNGLLIVSVVGWAVWLWYIGTATIGVVAAATALTLQLNAMTGWIMWALSSLFRELGVVMEGMETIAQPITLRDRAGAVPLKFEKGLIEFDRVSHHYGRGAGGLDGLSLTIQPGEKVGLVGRSGAGKSTLVKLLLRFYDCEGGCIRIDGQDIAEVTQDSLRAHMGVVQQDNSLLHRSLRDNIAYGRPDATMEEIIRAAKDAEALAFIHDLEDPEGRRGFDAHVGERGVKLSGGQRQRISLARVMLKDAPILILDEATSALDSEIEANIQNSLHSLMAGKTVIAIAHRLSTIAQMDRIIVLDDGHIIEDGPHAALLEKGGLYATLWSRQSGGFLQLDGARD